MASLPEHLMPTPVGRDRLPREVLAEQQRERVLPAAAEVFAKRGYHGTTVDHIVSAAKIGVGSFYALFKGKEECFLAAYDRTVADGRARIEAGLPAGAPYPERACAALAGLLELIAEEPLRARLVLIEAQTAGAAGLARYEATLDGFVPVLRGCREFSPVAEELPDSMEFATLAGVVWFLQQRVADGNVADLAGALPSLAEIVLEPYLGRAQTEQLLAAVR